MFSRIFVLDAIERALKTVAQAILALLTMDGANILTVDVTALISTALTAGVISILTSIISTGVGSRESASLTINPPTPKG